MKTFKKILLSIGLILTTSSIAIAVYIQLQDESLEAEAKVFFTLSDDEKSKFKTTEQKLSDSRIDDQVELAKSSPCYSNERKKDSEYVNNFIKKWEDFQSSTEHFKKVIMPIIKDSEIAIGGSDFAVVIKSVTRARNLIFHAEAHACYLELMKLNLELNDTRRMIAEFALRSFESPNLILSSIIFAGLVRQFQKIFSEVDELDKFNKDLAQLIKSKTAEDKFWESARYDVISMKKNIEKGKSHINDFTEWMENLIIPQNKLLNKAWKACVKREIPEMPEELSDDKSILTVPERILESYEVMTFSRWIDGLKRFQDNWAQMHQFMSEKKTK